MALDPPRPEPGSLVLFRDGDGDLVAFVVCPGEGCPIVDEPGHVHSHQLFLNGRPWTDGPSVFGHEGN